MKKKLRTIQPAHHSDRITVEEAMAAWRKVEGKTAARTNKGSVRRVANGGSSGRAKIADSAKGSS